MSGDLRIFFATDIHGSDLCFRKFLNAAKFYDCDVLLMGGDMTGKMLIPLIAEAGGRWRTRLYGSIHEVEEGELPALRKAIGDAGYYAYETTPDEVAELEMDPDRVERLFHDRIRESLEGWLALADSKLRGSRKLCLVGPANDDPWFVDDILATSKTCINPAGRLIELPGGFAMVSVGVSNITPWASPRELPEDQLAELIQVELAKLDAPDRAIVNLHVPPKDSQLDQAILLDAELKPVLQGGRPVEAGVGSSAVRESIERFQPLLALHGHIHESRGACKLGRTLCLNPGSEYSEGILRGAIVTLSAKKGILGYQLVAG